VIAPGGLATSGGNFIVSNPAIAPSFSILAFTNNQFQFTVNGTTGSNYVVQVATNLTAMDWKPLLTNVAPFSFVETNAGTFGQRFFRATVAP
jgi:hypothetical protein